MNIALKILKIKETFLYLQNQKIEQVQKLISGESKPKPHINMTTKSLSHKQVIIPINNEIAKNYLKNSSTHIISINCTLKGIKSNVMADFICINNKGIVISTNNVANPSDLQEIKKCIRNSLNTDTDQISFPRLLQSKSYLKIISILYLVKHLNSCLSSNDVEKILKSNYIFNDIVLASKPRVIKVSPKLDMSIIWIDIWDMQNSSKAKTIINRCFNIGSFIATVYEVNMNPRAPQCKSCWKWEHTAGVCQIQDSKCVKCNGLHQTIHHHQFVWYYKVNDKINLPRLETKKDALCPYSFKCLNCKGKHQADSTNCPFWKYRFNKEWHSKEYTKLWEN